eukprot:694380-Alexandrium_andersonii.AAC.1
MSPNPSEPTEDTPSPHSTQLHRCDPATTPRHTLPRVRKSPAWADSTSSSFTLTPSATTDGGANAASATLSYLAASSTSHG